jgi:hypothetical protein
VWDYPVTHRNQGVIYFVSGLISSFDEIFRQSIYLFIAALILNPMLIAFGPSTVFIVDLRYRFLHGQNAILAIIVIICR